METRRLSSTMVLHEEALYNQRFPAERWAHVRVTLRDGTVLDSEPAIARGNPENALPDSEVHEKFMALSQPVMGAERAVQTAVAVLQVDQAGSRLGDLLDLALEPVGETGMAA
jgi:2-methylcitrate dehydratase PrpD